MGENIAEVTNRKFPSQVLLLWDAMMPVPNSRDCSDSDSRHTRYAWAYGICLPLAMLVSSAKTCVAQEFNTCTSPQLPLYPGTVEPPLAHAPMSGAVGGIPAVAGTPQDPEAPIVYLRMRAKAQSASGQEIEYKLTLENCSTAAAHHVFVRDSLPGNARFVRASPEPSEKGKELVWQFGTLAGGAKREISLVLSPTGGDEVKTCARVQFEHGECVSTRLTRPNLSVSKTGPERAVLYDSLSYQLALTNTGEAPLRNLLLTDILPSGMEHESGKNRLSWILGTLEPGETRSIKYKVIAKAAGKFCNKAIATADGDFRKEMESCLEVAEAKVALKMTGPKRHYVNSPATYHLAIANTGTAILENVVLDNPLPAGTALDHATPGYQPTSQGVRWLLRPLVPGATENFEIALRGQRAGEICNRATVSAQRGIMQNAETCTQFLAASAISLDVRDLQDPVEVGGTTAYEVLVQNGGITPVTHVAVTATVPDQMEILKVTGPTERRNGQTLTFEPITLDAHGTIRYLVEVRARRAGDVRFKVELTSDQLTGGAVQQEESTTIYSGLPTSLRRLRLLRPVILVGSA
jgi:uncharacterized repeat protein (TIGR01451 family)